MGKAEITHEILVGEETVIPFDWFVSLARPKGTYRYKAKVKYRGVRLSERWNEAIEKRFEIHGARWVNAFGDQDAGIKIVLNAVAKTTDKKYLVVGFSENTENEKSGIVLLVDTCGRVEWAKKLAGDDYDEVVLTDIKRDPDGGFIIGGYARKAKVDPIVKTVLE